MKNNNYDIIVGFPTGTIFRFEQGDPWMRTETGVVDLISDLRETAIPLLWKSYYYELSIIYLPEIFHEEESEVIRVNFAIFDMSKQLWGEDNGGPIAQARFWLNEIKDGEAYEGELDEFMDYLKSAHNILPEDIL